MDKLVSVIIPAYNVSKHIKDCVESILNQTHINIEILIYNDGSTDKTMKVLQEISRKSRVTVFNSKKNKGVSAARNYLLDQAKGEYIMMQDADDKSLKNRIEKCILFLENTDYVFTSCNIQTSDKRVLNFKDKDEIYILQKQFLCHRPITIASSFFHRKIIDSGIRFDTELLTGEDSLFIAEVQSKFPLKLRGLPDKTPYYWFRRHEPDEKIVSLSSVTVEKELLPFVKLQKRNDRIKQLMTRILLRYKGITETYHSLYPNLAYKEIQELYKNITGVKNV